MGTLKRVLEADSDLGTTWRSKELDRPFTIILDQVEELFAQSAQAVREEESAFVAFLKATWRDSGLVPKGKLVLGIRKEFEPELAVLLKELEIPYKEVFIRPLDKAGIIEAVCGIASDELKTHFDNLSIHPDVPSTIAEDLLSGEQFASIAPTLQILLHKLWTQAKAEHPNEPHFSLSLYRKLKQEGLLLQDYLDQQLARLDSQTLENGLALDLLFTHTSSLATAAHHPVSVLREHYLHTEMAFESLYAQLKDGYLLIESDGSSRLAHDTLAPLIIRRYNESDAPGQRARRILDNRFNLVDNGTVIPPPLDDLDLAMVEAGAKGMGKWTALEFKLVEKSRQAREKRIAEQEKIESERRMAQEAELRHEQEIAAAERKKRRIFQAGMSIALVMSLGIGWLSWSLNRSNKKLSSSNEEITLLYGTKDELEEQQTQLMKELGVSDSLINQSRQLIDAQTDTLRQFVDSTQKLERLTYNANLAFRANQASNEALALLQSGNKRAAIQTAYQAYQMAPLSNITNSAFLTAMYDPMPVVLPYDKNLYPLLKTETNQRGEQIEIKGTQVMIKGSDEKVWFSYDLNALILSASFVKGYDDRIYVRVRDRQQPDRVLAYPEARYVWKGQAVRSFASHNMRKEVLFNTDAGQVGRLILNEHKNGWQGVVPSNLVNPGKSIIDISGSRGHYLLTADRLLQVYDANDSKILLTLNAPDSDRDYLLTRFPNQNTKLLTTAETRGRVSIWNWKLSPIKPIWVAKLPDTTQIIIRDIRFSPDDRYLLTGDSKGNLYVWDWKVGLLKEKYFFDQAVQRLAFSPKGRWLAVATAGGEVQLYPWSSRIQSFDRSRWKTISHRGAVNSLTFAELKGQLLLATGASDQMVRLFSISNRGAEKRWEFNTGSLVREVAFVGDQLLVGDMGGLWRPFELNPERIRNKLLDQNIFNP